MKKSKINPDPNLLRVLILEDNPAAAELIERELRRAGIIFTSQLAMGKRDYSKALADFQPQVILSDFKLQSFDGIAALKIARTQAPDTPFIFVSGSIGEEKAIETLAQGAADYVLKDNLARLGPAVKRVVEAARLKLEKKKTDEELRRHVEELQLLVETADRFVNINDLDQIHDYLAGVISDISGADYLMLSQYDEELKAVRPKKIKGFAPFSETIRRRFGIDPMQMVFSLDDTLPEDFYGFVSRRLVPVPDGLYGLSNRKMPRLVCRAIEKLLGISIMHSMGLSWENQLYGSLTLFFKKNSELKQPEQIEAVINLAAVAIKRLLAEKSLRASEERFRRISATISDISYSCISQGDAGFSLSWLTGAVERITGYSLEEIMAMKCWGKLVLKDDLPLFKKNVIGLAVNTSGVCELRFRQKNGNVVWVQSFAECVPRQEQAEQLVLYGGLVDISERKSMDDRLRQSEEYYRTLVETSPDAIIIVDAGGRITFASKKAFDVFAIPSDTAVIGTSMLEYVEPAEADKVQTRLVEILSGRALPEIREYRLLQHDRRPFWGEISSSPLRDTKGRSVGLLLVCRDVSERKQAEKELRESEERYRLLLEHAPIGIAVHADCQIIFVNQAAAEILGAATPQQIMGKKVEEIIPPENLDDSKDRIKRLQIGERGLYPVEDVYLRLDGTRVPVEVMAIPFSFHGRRAVQVIFSDVTERKRAEEQIHYQASLLRNVSDAIIASNKNNEIQIWNKAAENIYGWKSAEVIGKKFRAVINPEYGFQSREEVFKTMKETGVWSGEIIHHHRDGNPLTVQSSIKILKDADGNQTGMVSVNHDISERKLSEKALQDAHDRLAATLAAIPDLLFEVDHSGRIYDYNSPKNGALYVPPEEFLNKTVDDVLPADAAHVIHEALNEAHQNGTHRGAVYKLDLPNGPAWYELSIACKGETGRPDSRFVVTARDISERKVAEEALKESYNRFQLANRATFNAIWDWNFRTDAIWWNENFQLLFGYQANEIEPGIESWTRRIHPEDMDRVVKGIHSAIDSGRETWSDQYRFRRKDGSYADIADRGLISRDGNGKPTRMIGAMEDITEHQRAEEQIHASLKEKEVLLQEIHHRVKNNLQIISGLLTLQADKAAGKPIEEIFRESQDRIRSIALIHEKLYHSQNLAEIDFGQYLCALTEDLFTSYGIVAGRITVRFETEPVFFSIEVAIPLGLIVNELITNALKHAFPDGRQGEIRIALHECGDKSRLVPTDQHRAPSYELIVADNGVGLPAGQIPEQQKSLGMNLVSMLVRQLEAELEIKTGPGVNFRLLLPGAAACRGKKP